MLTTMFNYKPMKLGCQLDTTENMHILTFLDSKIHALGSRMAAILDFDYDCEWIFYISDYIHLPDIF